jgi:hypothetical protein
MAIATDQTNAAFVDVIGAQNHERFQLLID